MKKFIRVTFEILTGTMSEPDTKNENKENIKFILRYTYGRRKEVKRVYWKNFAETVNPEKAKELTMGKFN